MKTNLMDLIKKLEMELTRKDGEWAISVPGKNKPTQSEVKTIVANKQEIINILREERAIEIAQERKSKEEKEIVVEYQEGEILSGYAVKENEDMMVELGLAKMVSGWGYLVDKEIIKALGTTFTVAQARAYISNTKKETITEEEKIANLKETAKVLGHKVEVRSYSLECDGEVSECDTDIITEYIDSKGRVTKTRVHTQ